MDARRADRTPEQVKADRDRNAAHQVASRAARTSEEVAAEKARIAASRAARTSEQVAAEKARGAARYAARTAEEIAAEAARKHGNYLSVTKKHRNERNLKLEEETRAAAALHAEQLGFLGAFDTQRKISERLIISEKLLRESCKPRVELERIADAMFSTRVQVRN